MPDWQNIEQAHRLSVWNVVYRILMHDEDARDCCQEVFLEAIRQQDSSEIHNWGGYLRWLATRRAIDFLRSKRRQRTDFVTLNDDVGTESDNTEVEMRELSEVVRHELSRLPENQSTAFWLSSVEELSYEEIAALTGGTVNAVGLRIHRAREALRMRLAGLNRIPSESPNV